MRGFRWVVVLTMAVLSSSAWAGVDLTQGVWLVEGKDTADWEADLIFTSQLPIGDDYDLEGYFDWNATNKVAGAREFFEGTLFSDLTFHLVGVRKEMEFGSGITLSIYDGRVTLDGKEIDDGEWGVNVRGEWTAQLVPEPTSLGVLAIGAMLLPHRRMS